MIHESGSSKSELIERIPSLLPLEPDGLRHKDIIAKLGEPHPHKETLDRALEDLIEKGAIAKSFTVIDAKPTPTYSRPSVNLEKADLVTVVRASNVMIDATLLAIKSRKELRSRILEHVVRKHIVDATGSNLDILRFRLEKGSFKAPFITIRDALPEYRLQETFRKMYMTRAVFKSDFDMVLKKAVTSLHEEGEAEIRKLVGIMKNVKPKYRVRPMYFEREAKRPQSRQ